TRAGCSPSGKGAYLAGWAGSTSHLVTQDMKLGSRLSHASSCGKFMVTLHVQPCVVLHFPAERPNPAAAQKCVRLHSDDLARIQDVQRVEGRLDAPLQLEDRWLQGFDEVLPFRRADTVLARNLSAELAAFGVQRAPELVVSPLPGGFIQIAAHDVDVHVAVA